MTRVMIRFKERINLEGCLKLERAILDLLKDRFGVIPERVEWAKQLKNDGIAEIVLVENLSQNLD